MGEGLWGEFESGNKNNRGQIILKGFIFPLFLPLSLSVSLFPFSLLPSLPPFNSLLLLSLPLSPPPPPSLSLLLSLLLISLRVGRVIRSSRLGKRCWRPHLQSGRAQGSSRVWMAQGTGSGWGSQTGCRWRTRTAGSLRRSSCYCAWEEQHQHEEEQERSVWTASSRYCVSYWEDGAEDSVTLTPPPTDPDSSPY